MLDFGRWIVEVAVNGVKSGSFDRAWAAMQLGNHYSRDRITAEDIARFDICRRHGIIVAESAADKTLPPLSSSYSIYREYRYGKIKLTVYHRNED